MADSWPNSLCEKDNTDWGWNYDVTLEQLAETILKDIKRKGTADI